MRKTQACSSHSMERTAKHQPCTMAKQQPFLKKQQQSQEDLSHPSEDLVTTVNPYDILCGRSKQSFENVGNRRFRLTINMRLHDYVSARSKKYKSRIVRDIYANLVERIGARFLVEHPTTTSQSKQQPVYSLLDEEAGLSKVSHAIRDMAKREARKKKKQAMKNKTLK